jgi:hypothetical protein
MKVNYPVPRVTPWQTILPVYYRMSEMVVFICQTVLEDGLPCGTIESRSRPKRGPLPSVCETCLWWSKHGTHITKDRKRPRDIVEVHRLMKLFPTGTPQSSVHDRHLTALRETPAPEIVAMDHYGTYRFGQRLETLKRQRQLGMNLVETMELPADDRVSKPKPSLILSKNVSKRERRILSAIRRPSQGGTDE